MKTPSKKMKKTSTYYMDMKILVTRRSAVAERTILSLYRAGFYLPMSQVWMLERCVVKKKEPGEWLYKEAYANNVFRTTQSARNVIVRLKKVGINISKTGKLTIKRPVSGKTVIIKQHRICEYRLKSSSS